MPERFEHRKKPFKTGVTFNRDVQTAGLAGPERVEFRRQLVDLGQDAFSRTKQLLTSRRQLQRLRAAHEQFDPGLVLKPLHLVRKR